MSIQQGMFTAIHFKHIFFDGSWDQAALIDFYEYTALKPSQLFVMEEFKSGFNMVWIFSLRPGAKVTVNYADSQVHVPARVTRTYPPWSSVGIAEWPSGSQRRSVSRKRKKSGRAARKA
jgi:hypothetical protein